MSHLDLIRCMQRSVKRAGLPLWFTEGFNPRPYLMFALALSLGFESRCEVLDFTLTEPVAPEEIQARLNAAFPDGLRIRSVGVPTMKPTLIASSDYEVTIACEAPQAWQAAFDAFLAKEQILVEKRNKKKERKQMDLKPLVTLLSEQVLEDGVTLLLRLPSGNAVNVNPMLLLDAFAASGTMPESRVCKVERQKIICEDGKEFL